MVYSAFVSFIVELLVIGLFQSVVSGNSAEPNLQVAGPNDRSYRSYFVFKKEQKLN